MRAPSGVNRFGIVVLVLVTCVLMATKASSAPTADTEPNDSIPGAQSVDSFFDLSFNVQIENAAGVNTSTSIRHAEVVSPPTDFSGTADYFSFFVAATERITIDIDCASGAPPLTGCPPGTYEMDSVIRLYDPSSTFVASSDDCFTGATDTGSEGDECDTVDSFLTYTDTAGGGTYTVSVREWNDPGIIPGVDYTLNISVTTAAPVPALSPVGMAVLTSLFAIASYRRLRV